MDLNIAFIGSGNVATHLAKSLYKCGVKVSQIYSRSITNAQELATIVNAKATNNLYEIDANTDLIFICTPDAAVAEIVKLLSFEPKLIVHTAGSLPLSIFNNFNNYGVFYPLQSFSKHVSVQMKNVPICIEANNKKNEQILLALARLLSANVYELTSDQRKACHLAAVFANNFSNHMFTIAESILNENDLPFDIIKPLIQETLEKVQTTSPKRAQTGPALRNDIKTQKEHLDMLQSTHLKKIYTFVSESIYEQNNQEKLKNKA